MKIFLVMVAIVFASSVIVNAQEKDCCKDKNKSECTKNQKSDCSSKIGNSQGTVMSDSAKLCPVSGEPVNHDGESVKYSYLGKEYEFCCEGCLKKFKAEPMSYIKTELTCPVMGEAAAKDVSTVVDGVKYYFCCEMCIAKFNKDPKKYLDKVK